MVSGLEWYVVEPCLLGVTLCTLATGVHPVCTRHILWVGVGV